MIQRIWHGWTEPENADAYEELLRREVLPGIEARGVPGYGGASVLRRDTDDEVEFMTTLRFATLDAVRTFAGEDHEASYVPAAARALLSRWEQRAAHYDVVLEPGPQGAATTARGRALAEAVRATFTGPMWHGPSLGEAVRDLSAEQAAAHPVQGAHSIWELVSHVAAWADIARERIAGTAVEVSPERNFPPVVETTGDAWARAVRTMRERYDALAEAVSRLDEHALAREVAPGQPTVEALARGVVEHGVYHAGQMSLLRRAQGVQPPPS